MNYTYILFDLDGTLFDPKIGMTKSIRYAFEKIGLEEPDDKKIERLFGPPLQLSLQKYYNVSEEKAWEAIAYYREYLGDFGIYEYLAYEGIKDLLEELKKLDKTLYVVTMKPAKYTLPILEHFDMSTYFSGIYAPDLEGKINKKVDLIKQVLELHPTVSKEHFVMVGDREDDVFAAHDAGINSIAVGFGYGSEEELQQAKATHHVPTVKHLQELLLQ